jgi:hypothetical protein
VRDDLRVVEADQRRLANRGSHTNKPITDKAEILGVAGEDAWIEWCHKHGIVPGPRPTSRHRGVQFRTQGLSVKILCTETPGNLLVKANTKEWANVYLLASYDRHTKRATLVGWLPGTCMKEAPIRDMARAGSDYRLESHAVKSRDLASMSMLQEVFSETNSFGLEDVEAWWSAQQPTAKVGAAAAREVPATPEPLQMGFDFGAASLGTRRSYTD